MRDRAEHAGAREPGDEGAPAGERAAALVDPVAADEALVRFGGRTRPLRKLVVTVGWLAASASPSLVLLALGWRLASTSRGDQTAVFLAFLWVLCAIVSAPAARKVLGAVPEVKALPPDERRLEHLSPRCARLVREAETIRVHLDAIGFAAALQQAWALANEAEQAGPELRAELERAGASLHGVRELVVGRAAGASEDAELQRSRLIAALTRFEHALRSPRTRAFR